MVFEGEAAVKNNSKVADLCRGRQSGVINGEAEVMSGFSEGFGANDDHI